MAGMHPFIAALLKQAEEANARALAEMEQERGGGLGGYMGGGFPMGGGLLGGLMGQSNGSAPGGYSNGPSVTPPVLPRTADISAATGTGAQSAGVYAAPSRGEPGAPGVDGVSTSLDNFESASVNAFDAAGGPSVYAAPMQGQSLSDYIVYENQGNIRSQPLSPELVNALSFLGDMGIEARVFSGGQPQAGHGPRTGSVRHDDGDAADVSFWKDGRRLDWANEADIPIFDEIVRRGKAAGLSGFGAGIGDAYMGSGNMHLGFGNPAVWGANGASANAPDWLRAAYSNANPLPALMNAPRGTFDASIMAAGGSTPISLAAAGVPQQRSQTSADASGILSGLVSRGVPLHAAQGIVMNMIDESNLNPGLVERNPTSAGAGYGLAQWTGPRRTALESFAAESGRPVSDVDLQLDFLMHELNGQYKGVYDSMVASGDPRQSAAIFLNKFEIPAEKYRLRREASYLGNAAIPSAPRSPTVAEGITGVNAAPVISTKSERPGSMFSPDFEVGIGYGYRGQPGSFWHDTPGLWRAHDAQYADNSQFLRPTSFEQQPGWIEVGQRDGRPVYMAPQPIYDTSSGQPQGWSRARAIDAAKQNGWLIPTQSELDSLYSKATGITMPTWPNATGTTQQYLDSLSSTLQQRGLGPSAPIYHGKELFALGGTQTLPQPVVPVKPAITPSSLGAATMAALSATKPLTGLGAVMNPMTRFNMFPSGGGL